MAIVVLEFNFGGLQAQTIRGIRQLQNFETYGNLEAPNLFKFKI